MDRFLVKVALGYPGGESERRVLEVYSGEVEPVQPVLTAAEVLRLQALASDVRAERDVLDYISRSRKGRAAIHASRSAHRPAPRSGCSGPRRRVRSCAAARTRCPTTSSSWRRPCSRTGSCWGRTRSWTG